MAEAVKITPEQLEQLAQQTGDNPVHIQNMIAKADGVEGNAGGQDTGDQLLAGKFKDQDSLNAGIQSLIDKFGSEQAYKHLESLMGQQSPAGADSDALSGGESAAKEGTQDALSGDDSEDNSSDNESSDNGNSEQKLDLEAINAEFVENGELSDASYNALENAGFGREYVDQFIAGMEAQARVYEMEIHKLAGGEDAFSTLLEWGSQSLTESEITRFNDAIGSQDVEQAGIMIDALKARYERAEGTMSRLRHEGSEAQTSSAGYQTMDELRKDQTDPRYKSDPTFRKAVEAKLAKTTVF